MWGERFSIEGDIVDASRVLLLNHRREYYTIDYATKPATRDGGKTCDVRHTALIET